jgi:hypothetical protein
MATNETAAQPLSRQDIEAKIVALAWQDDEFCKKFLADPKAQFEEHLGTKLPDSLKITAHQEDSNHLHFVIPLKPQANLDELSDEDLEKVAGGIDGVILTLAVSAAVAWGAGGSAVSALATEKYGKW